MHAERMAFQFLSHAISNVEKLEYSGLVLFADRLQIESANVALALGFLEEAITCVKDKLDEVPPSLSLRMWYIRGLELLIRHYFSNPRSAQRFRSLFEDAKSWLTQDLTAADNCLFAALYDQLYQQYNMVFSQSRQPLAQLFMNRVESYKQEIVRDHPPWSLVMQGTSSLVVVEKLDNAGFSSIRVIDPNAVRLEISRDIKHFLVAPDPASRGQDLKMQVKIRGEQWYDRNFPNAFNLFQKKLGWETENSH